MEKILYFFKMHDIECEYIGKFRKVGLKKDKTLLNYLVEIESYHINHNNKIYTLDRKISGRPQYILLNTNLLINAYSQPQFIEKFKELEKVKKSNIRVAKEKIQGIVFRMLRHYLKLNKKQLGQSIKKSELTIIRYEAGTLALHSSVVLATLTVHNLKLSVYIDIFKNVLKDRKINYSINDFKINKELISFYEKYGGVTMADFLTADEVSIICKIKKQKAYKIIKEINDEMGKKGFIIIRGRVNRKFFNEKMGLIDYFEKGGK